MEDKSNVISDIKDDAIFERTKALIEMESENDQLNNSQRRMTINAKGANDLYKEQKFSRDIMKFKAQGSKKKKGEIDPRCKDEIDELKKIFYKFFVLSESLH